MRRTRFCLYTLKITFANNYRLYTVTDNYVKTSSYIEILIQIDLEIVLLSAKMIFVHIWNIGFSDSKKMYPLKLWHCPWVGVIFSDRVIELAVRYWYQTAWGFTDSARQILTI